MMANRIVSLGCAATLVAGISPHNVAVMITLNVPTAIFMLTIHARLRQLTRTLESVANLAV